MGSDAPLSDIHHGSIVEFETVVRPVPQYNTEDPKMISQGPSLCIFNKEDSGAVMASLLFVQYLLSNETQIAYSQTEGYLPVTEKAQNSAEYQDYLSRSGEDNDKYYNVKIESVKLLMNYTDCTFTTAVFNGSASLRNAAGQMIEEVCKAVNRKKNVNDKFIANLYEDVTKLYRLDQIGNFDGKLRLGDLPATAVALLCGIGATWIGIITYVVISYYKKQKR
jgi:multiple sugar transport system substrate-binding protein